MKKYGFGADVGGTTIKMGLFEMDGTLVEKWEIPTDTTEKGAHILQDIAATVHGKMVENDLTKDMVEGIGIGVPGAVDKDGVVNRAVNLGWDIVPLAEELGKLSGMKVKVGNDANVAALGEMWRGGGMGFTDIVMVTLGTGVGGGIIIDEKIIAGKHGLGGEIGHVHVRDEEWEHCNCGGVGCVEQIASATGIAREARRRMAGEETPSVLRQYGDAVTAKDVLDAAKAGDELALSVVETVGRYLGVALAGIAMTVDPQMFVIGGGVSKAGQFLIDIIDKYYQHYSPISQNKGVIGLAKLGNDAGIYGAARLVLG